MLPRRFHRTRALPAVALLPGIALGLILAGAVGLAGCGDSPPSGPGLGEIMTLTQMRHAKLWFAGEAGNWPLAAYELDELKEGFDDVMKYHPTHKESTVVTTDALPKLMTRPLGELKTAIDARDLRMFTAGFDALTVACNACHSAMQFEFNVVKRPTANPYSNQLFAEPKGADRPH